MIQNLVKTFDQEEIEDDTFEEYLNECGKEDFRLHTCEPLGNGRVLTVMERYIETSGEPEPDMDEPTNAGGMVMKS